MPASVASEKILFDFRATTHLPEWQIVNDDVMGGESTSRFEFVTNGWAVFSGTVSLENNGGFASVRSSPIAQNLHGYDVLALRVRGDGRRYKVTARTTTGPKAPLYQCALPTKRAAWEEHRLRFDDFVPTFRGRVLDNVPRLNPAAVTTLGFLISDKQAGPFKLEIIGINASIETP